MARDIYTVMTREEAVEYFDDNILPAIIEQETEWQGGTWKWVDECHRCETWNNWTDSLCKDRVISDWQYENWDHPPSCGD
jgi:hypothetical protein